MKLQIDTDKKTIRIENNIKLSKLIESLKKLLPNEWEEFILETNTTINNWSSPIIYKEVYPSWPNYPWYQPSPYVYCGGSTSSSNSYKSYKDNKDICELKS